MLGAAGRRLPASSLYLSSGQTRSMHFQSQIQVFTLKSHLHMDAAIFFFCTAVSSNWNLVIKYYVGI